MTLEQYSKDVKEFKEKNDSAKKLKELKEDAGKAFKATEELVDRIAKGTPAIYSGELKATAEGKKKELEAKKTQLDKLDKLDNENVEVFAIALGSILDSVIAEVEKPAQEAEAKKAEEEKARIDAEKKKDDENRAEVAKYPAIDSKIKKDITGEKSLVKAYAIASEMLLAAKLGAAMPTYPKVQEILSAINADPEIQKLKIMEAEAVFESGKADSKIAEMSDDEKRIFGEKTVTYVGGASSEKFLDSKVEKFNDEQLKNYSRMFEFAIKYKDNIKFEPDSDSQYLNEANVANLQRFIEAVKSGGDLKEAKTIAKERIFSENLMNMGLCLLRAEAYKKGKTGNLLDEKDKILIKLNSEKKAGVLLEDKAPQDVQKSIKVADETCVACNESDATINKLTAEIEDLKNKLKNDKEGINKWHLLLAVAVGSLATYLLLKSGIAAATKEKLKKTVEWAKEKIKKAPSQVVDAATSKEILDIQKMVSPDDPNVKKALDGLNSAGERPLLNVEDLKKRVDEKILEVTNKMKNLNIDLDNNSLDRVKNTQAFDALTAELDGLKKMKVDLDDTTKAPAIFEQYKKNGKIDVTSIDNMDSFAKVLEDVLAQRETGIGLERDLHTEMDRITREVVLDGIRREVFDIKTADSLKSAINVKINHIEDQLKTSNASIKHHSARFFDLSDGPEKQNLSAEIEKMHLETQKLQAELDVLTQIKAEMEVDGGAEKVFAEFDVIRNAPLETVIAGVDANGNATRTTEVLGDDGRTTRTTEVFDSTGKVSSKEIVVTHTNAAGEIITDKSTYGADGRMTSGSGGGAPRVAPPVNPIAAPSADTTPKVDSPAPVDVKTPPTMTFSDDEKRVLGEIATTFRGDTHQQLKIELETRAKNIKDTQATLGRKMVLLGTRLKNATTLVDRVEINLEIEETKNGYSKLVSELQVLNDLSEKMKTGGGPDKVYKQYKEELSNRTSTEASAEKTQVVDATRYTAPVEANPQPTAEAARPSAPDVVNFTEMAAKERYDVLIADLEKVSGQYNNQINRLEKNRQLAPTLVAKRKQELLQKLLAENPKVAEQLKYFEDNRAAIDALPDGDLKKNIKSLQKNGTYNLSGVEEKIRTPAPNVQSRTSPLNRTSENPNFNSRATAINIPQKRLRIN